MRVIVRNAMSTNRALDLLFFAAEVNAAHVSDLKAASILAESMLHRGSRIDVWADDRFWAARIMSINQKGFEFRYCCKFGSERGFVKRKHFQTRWRFPVDNARQIVLAEALKKVTHE